MATLKEQKQAKLQQGFIEGNNCSNCKHTKRESAYGSRYRCTLGGFLIPYPRESRCNKVDIE